MSDSDAESIREPDEVSMENHISLISSVHELDGFKRTRDDEEVGFEEAVSSVTMHGNRKLHAYEALSANLVNAESKRSKKAVRKAHQTKKTLSRTEDAAAKREAYYMNAKKEVSFWEPVVNARRVARCIEYPVGSSGPGVYGLNEIVKPVTPYTPLEKEIAELQKKVKPVNECEKNNPGDKKKTLINITDANEAAAWRAHVRKVRALVEFQKSKSRRIKKIKSKNYRKITRKQKAKAEDKLLLNKAKDDPEFVATQIEDFKLNRIKERMTLKHKKTNKKLKRIATYAKYNKEARQVLHEHKELGARLTKTGDFISDSDDDEEQEEKKKVNESINDVKKVRFIDDLTKHNGADVTGNVIIMNESKSNSSHAQGNTAVAVKSNDTVSVMKSIANISSWVDSDSDDSSSKVEKTTDSVKKDGCLELANVEACSSDTVKKKKKSSTNSSQKRKSSSDINERQSEQKKKPKKQKDERQNLVQAIGDEDLVTLSAALDEYELDFIKNKKEDIEKSKPVELDMNLPGWGCWAGGPLGACKRKNKNLIIKPPPTPARQDVDLPNVIINEMKDMKFSNHQIKDLPFPYTSVIDFEETLKQPLGKEWNPEMAFRKLNTPDKKTKLGTVIPPISRDVVPNLPHSSVQKHKKTDALKTTNIFVPLQRC